MFGEDELLNEIYNHGKPKPQISNYTVVCDSFDAEVLFANIDDIYKMLKNERGILNFINEQFMEKCPDQQLTDNFFNQVFNANKG